MGERKGTYIAKSPTRKKDIRNCDIRTKSGAYLGEQVQTICINRAITVFILPKRSDGGGNGVDSAV